MRKTIVAALAIAVIGALSATASAQGRGGDGGERFYPFGQGEVGAVRNIVRDTLAQNPSIAAQALSQALNRQQERERTLATYALRRLNARAKSMLDSDDPRVKGDKGVAVHVMTGLAGCAECERLDRTVKSLTGDDQVRFIYHDFAQNDGAGLQGLALAEAAADNGRYWEFRDKVAAAYDGSGVKGAKSAAKARQDAYESVADSMGLKPDPDFERADLMDRMSMLIELGQSALPVVAVGQDVRQGAMRTSELRKMVSDAIERARRQQQRRQGAQQRQSAPKGGGQPSSGE